MKAEITDLLREARNADSLPLVTSLLSRAKDIALQWINREKSAEGYVLLAAVLAEFAQNGTSADERANYWREALLTVGKGWQVTEKTDCALQLSALTVDSTEDTFAARMPSENRSDLARAKSILDQSQVPGQAPPVRAKILSRKAAILRFQASFAQTPDSSKRLADESLRCAEAARRLDDGDGEASLQEGLALWFATRWSRSDLDYNQLLQKAEERFWTSVARANDIHGLLTLARFFRLTYQSPQSCRTFRQYASVEVQRRRLWRNLYIHAESALQLWYGKYPREFVSGEMDFAQRMLEESLSGGVITARNIVDLAFLKACSGDRDGAETVLHDIYTGGDNLDWQRAVQIAQDRFWQGSSDLAAQGFALGIDDAKVWNKLATYVWDFHGEGEFAEVLYRQALKLSPRDPPALTNLARLLVMSGAPHQLREADRLLQKAANFSDLRFHWWRAVRSMWRSAQGDRTGLKPPAPLSAPVRVPTDITSMDSLRRSFSLIKRMKADTPSECSQRGRAFQDWLHQLSKITLKNAVPAYREVDQKYGDIDGAAYLDFDSLRYEARWESKPTPDIDINHFAARLDVAGVTGLFVSMSGFTGPAVEAAKKHIAQRRLMLMDGDEVGVVADGVVPFDEVLRRKRMALDYESNPYHRIAVEAPRATI